MSILVLRFLLGSIQIFGWNKLVTTRLWFSLQESSEFRVVDKRKLIENKFWNALLSFSWMEWTMINIQKYSEILSIIRWFDACAVLWNSRVKCPLNFQLALILFNDYFSVCDEYYVRFLFLYWKKLRVVEDCKITLKGIIEHSSQFTRSQNSPQLDVNNRL